jgi:AhpD family alkylhydroperoxidase
MRAFFKPAATIASDRGGVSTTSARQSASADHQADFRTEGIRMLDWTTYRAELKGRVGDFGKAAPEALRGYAALAGGAAKTTHLDARTRELISLAVAVTTRCDGCITSHVDAAIKVGVSREEIAEALGVAIAMNAGAALVYSARTLDCFEQMTAPAPAAAE